ncbi:MAG TPA: hypothetical protein VFA81_03270 [Burkholderiales bacterium]|nr:hypothetical protein [Burkholderiales bacterium]
MIDARYLGEVGVMSAELRDAVKKAGFDADYIIIAQRTGNVEPKQEFVWHVLNATQDVQKLDMRTWGDFTPNPSVKIRPNSAGELMVVIGANAQVNFCGTVLGRWVWV